MTPYRTLFIPGIEGQQKLWSYDVLPVCHQVDYIVNFGNIIGCNDQVADQSSPRDNYNETTMRFVNLYRSYCDEWIQLIGTNELAALAQPDKWTNNITLERLRQWWLEQQWSCYVAYAYHERLLTHGGLTHGEWVDIGRPHTAREAADALNDKYLGTLYQGPAYKLTGSPNYHANPIWADPYMELYPSWTTAPDVCPFDQVHASGDLNTTLGKRLVHTPESPLSYITKVQYKKYGSVTYVSDACFTGINLNIGDNILTRLSHLRSLYIEKT